MDHKPRKLLLIGVTTIFMSSLAIDVIGNYTPTTTVNAAKRNKKKSHKKQAKKQKAKVNRMSKLDKDK